MKKSKNGRVWAPETEEDLKLLDEMERRGELGPHYDSFADDPHMNGYPLDEAPDPDDWEFEDDPPPWLPKWLKAKAEAKKLGQKIDLSEWLDANVPDVPPVIGER